MSANPFFSIIVPTYNHAQFVAATLDSIRAQTDPDWEAVVVNDGSTDQTPEVLSRYAARDARIRVFHKPNGGTGSALNMALRQSRGEWICWLSSDDFFDPKKLAIHREWIRRDAACRFFFTYFRLFNQAKGTTVDHPLWGPLPEREFQLLGLFYRNFISGISICIHRPSWEVVGCFNERLRYAQDYDMWLRLLARHAGTFIPEWTCISRQHAGQGSETFQQACYYDTASAGIQFLNEHSFEEMFPLLDLADPSSALRAVERTLERAADETSFLYWYGAHSNLVARTLEWAWNRNLGPEIYQQRAAARRLIRQMLADYCRVLRGTPLGWHWQVASAAMSLTNPDFTYQPTLPLDVGLGFLHDLRSRGKAPLDDLRRYFKMQYNRELPPKPSRSGSRSVVICDANIANADRFSPGTAELAGRLHSAGCRVVVVGGGQERLSTREGIPCIETASTQSTDKVLRALVPADALVWRQPQENPDRHPFKKYCVMPSPTGDADAAMSRILEEESALPALPVTKLTGFPSLRRKVVFVSGSPWGGGAERVTYNVLHGLDPEKYDLHFVHLWRNQGLQINFAPGITVHDVEEEMHSIVGLRGPLWRRILRRGACTLRRFSDQCLRILQPGNLQPSLDPFVESIHNAWPQVVALANILRRIGHDALVIPVMEEATTRMWQAQAFAQQPFCVSLHTAESLALPLMFPSAHRLRIEQFLFQNACRSALAITFPSDGCKEDLVQHFQVPRHKIDVIPNPIDVRAVVKMSGETPEIPIPNLHGKCLFVHAARLSREKDHRLMLLACRELKKTLPNFLVLCLGEGDQRKDIERQIRQWQLQEHVLLLGAVRNPFAYMARAQGLLLTSQFESFALVLVEALACGAVPIAVDCPHGPREVLQNGKYGLLVPPNDPIALANAMHRTAQERALRESIRHVGLERADHYELSRVIVQWDAFLSKMACATESSAQSAREAA